MEAEDAQLGAVTNSSRHTDGLQKKGQMGGQKCVKRGADGKQWLNLPNQSSTFVYHISQSRQAKAASICVQQLKQL